MHLLGALILLNKYQILFFHLNFYNAVYFIKVIKYSNLHSL